MKTLKIIHKNQKIVWFVLAISSVANLHYSQKIIQIKQRVKSVCLVENEKSEKKEAICNFHVDFIMNNF